MKTERLIHNRPAFSGLYPTFEEWKQDRNHFFSFFWHTCLYPTFEEWKHSTCSFWLVINIMFISYLWGMKTMRSKCGIITLLVYILPLRNENSKSLVALLYTVLVYILPLRNENDWAKTNKDWTWTCLYPTFKEWKPPRLF